MKNYDDTVENSILSCLIVKPKLFEELLLTEKHFIKNKDLFKFLQQVYLKYHNLDMTLLVNEPNCPDNLVSSVSELMDMMIASSNFQSYCEKQLEIYKQYCISYAVTKLENKEIEVQEFINMINQLNNENVSVEFSHTEEEIYDLISSKKKTILFNRMKQLGSKVNFLENTFNIIAARPSVGKSAFALNMIEDLSQNYRCLYFNMEMTEKEMYERLVSINTKIPISYFTEQSKLQMRLIQESIHNLVSRNLKIINGSKSIQAMKSIIINEQKKGHTLVFIDYVGYVTTSNKKSNDRERVGEIVRELQTLTKDYDITIFCLAQINREGTEEPTKENLKDSGELEQSGHAILLLHNNSKDPINAIIPEMKIIVAKNRSGKTGYFTMNYDKRNQRFDEEEGYN
jgi:replicative DNA helicase